MPKAASVVGDTSEKYWTAEDARAARKAGALPSLPEPDIDPAARLEYERTPKPVAIGLYGDERERRASELRKKANEVLEKAGLRRRPW